MNIFSPVDDVHDAKKKIIIHHFIPKWPLTQQLQGPEINLPAGIMLSQSGPGDRPMGTAQVFLNEATSSLSRSFPTCIPPRSQSYSGQPGSSGGTSHPRPTMHSKYINARVSLDPCVDRDGYRRLNMEGIEEMLLALERIEQDEELPYS